MRFFFGILFSVFIFTSFENGVHSMTDEDGLKPNYTSIALNVTYRSVGNPQDIYNGFVRGYYHIVDLVVDVILPDALPEGKNQVKYLIILFCDIF